MGYLLQKLIRRIQDGDASKFLVFGTLIFFVSLLIAAIIFLPPFLRSGVSMDGIESEARASQKIPDDWHLAKQTTESVSAMIFYSDNLDDCTYSIYVSKLKRHTPKYFFRAGGSASEITQGVAEFRFEEYEERAYISMNTQKVDKIEIDCGYSIETIDIDSEKPFVCIVPFNRGDVRFYDVNGNVVESVERKL